MNICDDCNSLYKYPSWTDIDYVEKAPICKLCQKEIDEDHAMLCNCSTCFRCSNDETHNLKNHKLFVSGCLKTNADSLIWQRCLQEDVCFYIRVAILKYLKRVLKDDKPRRLRIVNNVNPTQIAS